QERLRKGHPRTDSAQGRKQFQSKERPGPDSVLAPWAAEKRFGIVGSDATEFVVEGGGLRSLLYDVLLRCAAGNTDRCDRIPGGRSIYALATVASRACAI